MKMNQQPWTRGGSKPREQARHTQSDAVLALLARSADGVFAVDTEQRIVFWSAVAEELLGRSADEVLGRNCYEVILSNDYEGHPFCRRECPAIKAARQGRGVPNYDMACRKNGTDIWLNVSIVPVPDSVAGEATAIHMIRDVSQRRRSERLAQATIETVTRFMPENSNATAEAKPYPVPGPSLTTREIEVLRLLADGLGTQALAQGLGLSEATIRNHIQRLLAKLGVHSRLEAVVYGARHGLI